MKRSILSIILFGLVLFIYGCSEQPTQPPHDSSFNSIQEPVASEPMLSGNTLTEAGPKITKVSGYSDGVGVVGGVYQGQPASAPSWASNKYKGMLGVDASPTMNDYWDILGSGFGTSSKLVTIVNNSTGSVLKDFTIRIILWTDSKIRISVSHKDDYKFTFMKSISIKVTLSGTSASVYPLTGVVGLYKGRPWGQCSWWVARNRMSLGLLAPPTAYSTTGNISESYIPKRSDCLTYGTKHVAYISSEPEKKTLADGSVQYTFTVSEMNAKWDELPSSYSGIFKLSKLVNGKRTILTQIGSNSGLKASGYYR